MATSSSQPKLVEKKCVVCGLGSHRADWLSKTNPACDHHSADEVEAATPKQSGKATKNPSTTPADSK